MATRTLSTKFALDGEAEYKAALKNINAEYYLHRSELEKVAAQYKENANSLKALEAKQSALAGILDSLKQKHEQHNTMLESARQAQQKYANQTEELKTKLAELKSASGGNAEQEQKLAKELAEAEKNLQKASNSVIYYQRQLNNTERDQAKFGSELEKTEKYLDEARASADGCATSIDNLGKEVKEAGEESQEFGGKSSDAVNALASALAAAGVAKAVNEIAEALRDCVDASIEFESAMAGVRRTVGGSSAEIAAMGQTFQALAVEIPITTSELGKIAETAGQLGVSKGQVEQFTQVMAMLGTTTDLTAENAATMLAQFANITGTDDFERLGATVAELGDSTATTASKVVEMAQGLAATASAAGMSERDILGISAAVGSLGMEAQAGSTSMSTLISTLHRAVETGSGNLASFAAVAGMSAEQFAAAWRGDPVKALDAFISGLNDVERNGRSAIVILDELGITNTRQIKAIQGLANANGLLTGTIEQANRAWEENTALQEKASVMYETTESKLILAGNAFNNVKIAIGDTLTPALEELAGAAASAFSWAADVIEQHPWLVQAITGVAAALGVLVTGVTALMVLEKIKPLLVEFNTVLSLNPALAVAAAVAGLVVALGSFAASAREANEQAAHMSESFREIKAAYSEASTAIRQESEDVLSMAAALDGLAGMEDKSAAQKDTLLSLVERLNQAVPELSLAYDEQTDSLNLTAEAIKKLALAQASQAELESKRDYLSSLYVEQETAVRNLADAEANLERAGKQLAEAQAALTSGSVEENEQLQQLQAEFGACTRAVKEYQAQQDTLNNEIAAAEAAYNELAAAVGSATGAVEANTGAAAENRIAHVNLLDVLGQAKGGYELLAKAQEETAQSGSLSISTLETLLKQYPELEKYLIATADGYMLAQGALEDYTAAQQAEYQLAYNNAASAAQAIIDAEGNKLAAVNATTQGVKNQLRALATLYQTKAQEAAFGADWANNDDYYSRGYNALSSNSDWKTAQEYLSALAKLEAAEDALQTSTRVTSMLARSYGSTSSSSSSSKSGTSSSASSSAKTAGQSAMEELQEWLSDIDHQIFLWSKDESKTEAIVGLYEGMQARVHGLAEDYRAKGYDETADEIQQLQKLWWGYSDQIGALRQDMYQRDLSALEAALEREELTIQEYTERRLELQNQYFQEGSQAWQEAEQARQEQVRKLGESAYSEALADIQYFLDMDIISQEEYYARMAALRDEFLQEDSAAWRSATVELHNYLEGCREAALASQEAALGAAKTDYHTRLAAAKSDYETQLKELEQALKDGQAAEKTDYESQLAAAKEAYTAQKAALKDAYQAQKAAAQEAYEAKKASVQAELALEQERLNAILDGINAEIQARRELREDEDLDGAVTQARKRLEAAQAQLAYARTDEDRAEWEKELVRLEDALAQALQNQEDTLFYREKAEEQGQVQAQLSEVKNQASKELEQAKAEYDACLNTLEANYNAGLAQAEAGYNAQTRRLEGNYNAALARLESRYDAQVRQLTAQYEANAERLDVEYDAQVQQLKAEYQAGLEQLETDYSARIRQLEASDRAVQAQLEASYGASLVRMEADFQTTLERARLESAELSRMVADTMATMTQTAIHQLTSVTNRTNSASVNIYGARALTEGEIQRTVRKVIETLDR